MTVNAGMLSLAVSLPETVRKNDYYSEKYPEKITDLHSQGLSRFYSSAKGSEERDSFTSAMAPYLSDPFRGTIERRVLRKHETALSLELRAARDALTARGMTID